MAAEHLDHNTFINHVFKDSSFTNDVTDYCWIKYLHLV